MANLITCFRIVLSIILIFCPVFSPAFYAVYLLAGLTDMADGVVARKTNTSTEFGSRLDSIADLIFFAFCFVKLIGVIVIPKWIYIWTAVIAVIKLINIICGFIMQKRLVAVHTIINKIVGIMLFALPLTLPYVDLKYSGLVVCFTATFASIQEGHFIRKGEYRG